MTAPKPDNTAPSRDPISPTAHQALELAACPFCDGTRIEPRPVRDGLKVVCLGCGAASRPEYHGPNKDTLERVIAAWNTRHGAEPCEYCGPGRYTGLPGNACENCMKTGLKYPGARHLALPSEPADVRGALEQLVRAAEHYDSGVAATPIQMGHWRTYIYPREAPLKEALLRAKATLTAPPPPQDGAGREPLVVDIGAAAEALQNSPELAAMMNELIGGPALVAAQAEIERLQALLATPPAPVTEPPPSAGGVEREAIARALFALDCHESDEEYKRERRRPPEKYADPWLPSGRRQLEALYRRADVFLAALRTTTPAQQAAPTPDEVK